MGVPRMVHKFVRIAGAGFLALFAAVVPALAVGSVLEGAYSEAQAARGEVLFTANCAPCHGNDLRGDDFYFPPLSGGEFTSKWRGRSLGDLFAFVTTYMPNDFPGTLDAQAYADAIAYILKFNGYPAGEAELPPGRELLNGVRFVTLP